MKTRIKSAFMGLDIHKYYGFQSNLPNDWGNKGFVTRSDFYNGDYIVLSPKYVTKGNTWSQHRNKTLDGLIDGLLNKNWTVYEFNTYESLFNWLIKKTK